MRGEGGQGNKKREEDYSSSRFHCDRETLLGGGGGRNVFLNHRCTTTEFDAALLIDPDALDPHLVAHLAHILDIADVAISKLADVNQAIAAREDFDEATELGDARHDAVINGTLFRLRGNHVDFAQGQFHAFLLAAEDLDDAIIIDVNLGAAEFDDPADVLATGADQFTDLINGNLDFRDARGVR